MTPELFKALLVSLFGDRYQAPAARSLNVSIKTIERNTNGETQAARHLENHAIILLREKIDADKKLLSLAHKVWWSERPNPSRMPREGDPGKQTYKPKLTPEIEALAEKIAGG